MVVPVVVPVLDTAATRSVGRLRSLKWIGKATAAKVNRHLNKGSDFDSVGHWRGVDPLSMERALRAAISVPPVEPRVRSVMAQLFPEGEFPLVPTLPKAFWPKYKSRHDLFLCFLLECDEDDFAFKRRFSHIPKFEFYHKKVRRIVRRLSS